MIGKIFKLFLKWRFNDFFFFSMRYIFRHLLFQYFSTLKFIVVAKLMGVSLGEKPKIFGKFKLVKFPNSKITVGKNFFAVGDGIRSSAVPVGMNRIVTHLPSAQVIIGNNVGVNGLSITCRSSKIVIGDESKIGPNCIIFDTDFHSLEPKHREEPGFERDKPVIVGENVFIGANCIILKGVVIGKNSIIGAGSVVTKDVRANSIYAGNPASFIRSLDD